LLGELLEAADNFNNGTITQAQLNAVQATFTRGIESGVAANKKQAEQYRKAPWAPTVSAAKTVSTDISLAISRLGDDFAGHLEHQTDRLIGEIEGLRDTVTNLGTVIGAISSILVGLSGYPMETL